MIIKLLKKIIPYLLVIVATFGNTGLFPSPKAKEIERKEPPKNPGFPPEEQMQFKPVVAPIVYKPETPLLRRPTPSLLYKGYNGQNIPQKTQSGQIAFFLTNADSTSAIRQVIIDFDYTTTGLQAMNVDIAEPKDFLASNLNEKLRERIDFYYDLPAFPKENL